ncbi:MAG: hypothetical protein HC902_00725 [Calothrix sp. SM1_5_4]|nr:hypothetical protein [Calothrix sp. SM1_5_4]
MSVEQKVGQVMIWSFIGTDLTPVLENTLTKYQPGGLIVFRRNITHPGQVARLNREIQALARRKLKAPLFLMIDQEGGVVTRIRTSTPMPSALALSKWETQTLSNGTAMPPASYSASLASMLTSPPYSIFPTNCATLSSATEPSATILRP